MPPPPSDTARQTEAVTGLNRGGRRAFKFLTSPAPAGSPKRALIPIAGG